MKFHSLVLGLFSAAAWMPMTSASKVCITLDQIKTDVKQPKPDEQGDKFDVAPPAAGVPQPDETETGSTSTGQPADTTGQPADTTGQRPVPVKGTVHINYFDTIKFNRAFVVLLFIYIHHLFWSYTNR